MGKLELRLLIAAVAAGVGYILFQQHQITESKKGRERAELEAGIRASEVLSEIFTSRAEFRVATLNGDAQSRGECRSGYFIPNQQITIAPYSSSYFVDLGRVDRSDFRWDAASRTMFVQVPDPAPEQPSIDMSKARTKQSGVFVSRTCGMAMQRQVAGRLSAVADRAAKRSDNLRRAREAGREALDRLVRAPVLAAGASPAKIVVRFTSDPRPVGDERWDMSRTIDEVRADPRFRP